MIKVVELSYVYFPASTTYSGVTEPERTELRMVTWKPKNDYSPGLVPQGFAISVDVESSIETLLTEAKYMACNRVADNKLGLSHLTCGTGSVIAALKPLAPPPEYRFSAQLLGNYRGQQVYAVMSVTNNCTMRLEKEGYEPSVVYNAETVQGAIALCADAQFFTEFLRDRLSTFEVVT